MARRRSETSATARGYGIEYQRARAALLAGGAPCFWCGGPASTGDHWPPKSAVGPHLHLVPACKRCNFGHVALRKWEELNGLASAPRPRPPRRRPPKPAPAQQFVLPSRDW
jgi:hypothetical protein